MEHVMEHVIEAINEACDAACSDVAGIYVDSESLSLSAKWDDASDVARVAIEGAASVARRVPMWRARDGVRSAVADVACDVGGVEITVWVDDGGKVFNIDVESY